MRFLQALISDFIYVDMKAKDDYDLSVHVMAIEERWFVLCGWIEGRGTALEEASKLWSGLEEGARVLHGWMEEAERTVKRMEQSPTEEERHLLQQVKDIKVSCIVITHSCKH